MGRSRLYSYSSEECQGRDFRMTVNGEELALHQARVSAYPINRRWPGHQRPLDQTELVSFASFAMDEDAVVTLVPDKPFKDVVVRPLSKGVSADVSDGRIQFTLPSPGFYTVELDGSHQALHVFADPLDVPGRPEGDVLYYGPGIHDVGVIELKTGQTLFIDEGAVVYARVHAKDADNIAIMGRGILDGSRNVERYLREFTEADRELVEKKFAVPNAKRTQTVDFLFCDHVLVRDIIIRDSLCYTIRPVCCRHVHIENVKVIGNWRYNSDGFDMHNCQDVVIKNCFLRTFDDSICIKGFDYILDEKDMFHDGESFTVFTDALIDGCVIWCDWGKSLEIGAETRAEDISRITFRNCDLIHNASIACDIFNVDYADVHDVTFEDIRIEQSLTQQPMYQNTDDQLFEDNPDCAYQPRILACVTVKHPEYSQAGKEPGRIRNIVFKDIAIVGGHQPTGSLSGFSDDYLTENVVIEHMTWNGRRLATLEETGVRLGEFTRNVTVVP